MKILHAYNDKYVAPSEYVILLDDTKDDSDFEEAQWRKDLEADGYEVTVFNYQPVPGSPSDMALRFRLPFMTPLVAE
jgi:hypothetical protein